MSQFSFGNFPHWVYDKRGIKCKTVIIITSANNLTCEWRLVHDTSWSSLCVFTQFGTESYIKTKVHINPWCTMRFARVTSLRLLVEVYQLFKRPEIDVLINVELRILVLLDPIMAHFVVVPVEVKKNADVVIPEIELLDSNLQYG